MDPRYPIGPFRYQGPLSPDARQQAIATIADTPRRLRAAAVGLSDLQLDTPYREGGWTVRQVVHHVPDSHLNAYTRLKLALTEDNPTIRPYAEAAWAELRDARLAPIDLSLDLLETLHRRWTAALGNLEPADFERRLLHPDSGAMTIDKLIALYAWHGPHHVAHVATLRAQRGW